MKNPSTQIRILAGPTNSMYLKEKNVSLSAHIGDNFKPLCNMHKIAMMAGLLRVFFSSFIFPYIFFLVLSCHGQTYTSQVKAWLIFWQIKWGFVCTKMMKYGWNHGLPETSPLFICQNRAVLINSFSVFIVLETYLWLLCCIVGTISSPRLSLWGNLCVQKDEKRFRFIPEV